MGPFYCICTSLSTDAIKTMTSTSNILGNVYFIEMDGMVHGRRPVCVVAAQNGKVWLMPLTTRIDCMQRWDVLIEPSAKRGVPRISKTSPDYTQCKQDTVLTGLNPTGRIEAELVKEMIAGYRTWKEASKCNKPVIKK